MASDLSRALADGGVAGGGHSEAHQAHDGKHAGVL